MTLHCHIAYVRLIGKYHTYGLCQLMTAIVLDVDRKSTRLNSSHT